MNTLLAILCALFPAGLVGGVLYQIWLKYGTKALLAVIIGSIITMVAVLGSAHFITKI
jgi:hypothetical protein